MSKYEHISINNTQLTVDISLLAKTNEMFFNATEMAKPFGKQVKDFLKTTPTKDYIKEVFKEDLNPLKNIDELVKIKRGKYGGTWLHNELAFEFAGWCSALFRRRLHKWSENRLIQEHDYKQKRLEAKTGFLPMTDAVQHAHDTIQSYHFSNEADLINRIVLGMTAKQYKNIHGVSNVRDAVLKYELTEISRLQIINTGLIEIGMDFQERKSKLIECHLKKASILPFISNEAA